MPPRSHIPARTSNDPRFAPVLDGGTIGVILFDYIGVVN